MNYGKLLYYDTANGPGCRTVLFVSGCRHHCKGCFNAETWNFQFGKPFTQKEIDKILESLAIPYITGFTILGGEPMEPENQPYILDLVKQIKKKYPEKTIWLYSGYTYEELTGQTSLHENLTDFLTKESIAHTIWTNPILEHIDVLVDGEFQIEKRDLSLAFRGSSNQRIIDIPMTIENNKIVLSKYMEK